MRIIFMFGGFIFGKVATIIFCVYTRKCFRKRWDFVPNTTL